MELAEKHEEHGFSQFELSKSVLHNLKHFDLTPTGKLVLLVLVDCYNPQNNAVVFPSMEFIANMAGIGLTATKQAIKDLILTGCIIKSKRGKIRGNYNKYLLTKKIQCGAFERPQLKSLDSIEKKESQKSKNDCLENFKSSKNDDFKRTDSDRFHEQTIEHKNNVVNISQNQEEVRDIHILEKYAKEHKATNVKAYINALRISGAAANIIEEHREQERIKKYWESQNKKTAEMVQEFKAFTADEPTESFKALKAQLLKICAK